MGKGKLERQWAGPECGRFLNLVGWAKKTRDAILCPHCHRPILPPGSQADYVGGINGQILAVEAKAAEFALPFSAFRHPKEGGGEYNQLQWAKWWTERSGGWWWLWLMLGNGRVNAINNPRQTWLLSLQTWLWIEETLSSVRKSLPKDLSRRPQRQVKESQLTATHLLAAYKMEWHGRIGWLPGREHPFWDVYGLQYEDYIGG